jgi:hypothetical protein
MLHELVRRFTATCKRTQPEQQDAWSALPVVSYVSALNNQSMPCMSLHAAVVKDAQTQRHVRRWR